MLGSGGPRITDEELNMPKKGHTEEEIIVALKQSKREKRLRVSVESPGSVKPHFTCGRSSTRGWECRRA